jgi:hypothetical protein
MFSSDERYGRGPQVSERRVASRRLSRRPIEVRVPDLGAVRGQLLNLTTHGLLAALPREIPLGVEVGLVLDFPEDPPPLEFTALGLRADRDASGAPPICVAFQFIHPSKEVLRRLAEMIFGG